MNNDKLALLVSVLNHKAERLPVPTNACITRPLIKSPEGR